MAIKHDHRNRGFSHRNWWFPIAMLVITRGYIIGFLGIGIHIARLRAYNKSTINSVCRSSGSMVDIQETWWWNTSHMTFGYILWFLRAKKRENLGKEAWKTHGFAGQHSADLEGNGRPEWFAQMVSWLARWFGGLLPNHGHLRKNNSFGLVGKISMTCWVRWREHLEFASFSILHQRMWSLLKNLKNHQQSRGKLHRSSGFRRHCKWMMLHAETLMINTGPFPLKSWFKNVSCCICRYPPLFTANETETNYRPT